MNRTLIILSAVLLIAGAVAIAIINNRGDEEPSATGTGAPGNRQPVERAMPGSGTPGGGAPQVDPERREREAREARLEETYGKIRTAQAREVSETVVSVLDDVVAVGEMMVEGGQQFGGRRGMVGGMTRRIGIELTEDQQDQALALYDEWQKGELEKSKQAVETLRGDPTALMELFLAADAKERGELGEDDYAAVRDEAAGRLEGVVNPLDRNNFRGDRMTEDDGLMDRFAEILDAEQQEKFSTYRDERAAAAAENPRRDGSITAMPTMQLDTLDEAVTGAKKMTSGFRSVMEGMGSLRQLQPQIDPEGTNE